MLLLLALRTRQWVEVRVSRPSWPWALLLLLAAVEAVWLLATPLRLAPGSIAFLINLAVGAAALLLLTRFTDVDGRLHSLLRGMAWLLVAWPVLRLFNHLAMTIPMPLGDPLLARWDRAIGFDWVAYLRWVDDHPALLSLMDLSYGGLTGYTILLFLALAFGPEYRARCEELLRLFLVTAMTCTLIGLFFPAEAAMAHLRPAMPFAHIAGDSGLYHLEHLHRLRTQPDAVLDFGAMPGLTTFPSFHTALGIVAIYCARSTPWLLLPSLTVNALMIASTPVFGSHYGVDVLAGASVAMIAILALRRATRGAIRPNNTCRIRPGSASSPSASPLPT